MKAKSVYENINFERGQDPKEALGIGLDQGIYDKWSKLMMEKGVGSVNIEDAAGGNYYLVIWVTQFPGAAGVAYDKAHKYFDEYLEDGYSMNQSEIHMKIKPEFERNFIGAYNLRYSDWPIVKESLDFERGQDPKRSMKIGKAAEEDMIIDSFMDMAGGNLRRFKWSFIKEIIADYTAYVINIIDSHDGPEYFVMIPGVSISYGGFPSAAAAVADMKIRLKRKNESLDFERGGDTHRAIGVGRREAYPDTDLFEEIHKHCEHCLRDGWPKEFEFVNPIDWSGMYPAFKVNLKDTKSEDPHYQFFLTKTGIKVFYGTYKDAGGGRRRWETQRYDVKDMIHFGRILASNHVQYMPR